MMIGGISEFVLTSMWGKSVSFALSISLIVSGGCLIAIALLSIGRHFSRKDLLRSVVSERLDLTNERDEIIRMRQLLLMSQDDTGHLLTD
jgi:hypothetical protein